MFNSLAGAADDTDLDPVPRRDSRNPVEAEEEGEVATTAPTAVTPSSDVVQYPDAAVSMSVSDVPPTENTVSALAESDVPSLPTFTIDAPAPTAELSTPVRAAQDNPDTSSSAGGRAPQITSTEDGFSVIGHADDDSDDSPSASDAPSVVMMPEEDDVVGRVFVAAAAEDQALAADSAPSNSVAQRRPGERVMGARSEIQWHGRGDEARLAAAPAPVAAVSGGYYGYGYDAYGRLVPLKAKKPVGGGRVDPTGRYAEFFTLVYNYRGGGGETSKLHLNNREKPGTQYYRCYECRRLLDEVILNGAASVSLFFLEARFQPHSYRLRFELNYSDSATSVEKKKRGEVVFPERRLYRAFFSVFHIGNPPRRTPGSAMKDLFLWRFSKPHEYAWEKFIIYLLELSQRENRGSHREDLRSFLKRFYRLRQQPGLKRRFCGEYPRRLTEPFRKVVFMHLLGEEAPPKRRSRQQPPLLTNAIAYGQLYDDVSGLKDLMSLVSVASDSFRLNILDGLKKLCRNSDDVLFYASVRCLTTWRIPGPLPLTRSYPDVLRRLEFEMNGAVGQTRSDNLIKELFQMAGGDLENIQLLLEFIERTASTVDRVQPRLNYPRSKLRAYFPEVLRVHFSAPLIVPWTEFLKKNAFLITARLTEVVLGLDFSNAPDRDSGVSLLLFLLEHHNFSARNWINLTTTTLSNIFVAGQPVAFLMEFFNRADAFVAPVGRKSEMKMCCERLLDEVFIENGVFPTETLEADIEEILMPFILDRVSSDAEYIHRLLSKLVVRETERKDGVGYVIICSLADRFGPFTVDSVMGNYLVWQNLFRFPQTIPQVDAAKEAARTYLTHLADGSATVAMVLKAFEIGDGIPVLSKVLDVRLPRNYVTVKEEEYRRFTNRVEDFNQFFIVFLMNDLIDSANERLIGHSLRNIDEAVFDELSGLLERYPFGAEELAELRLLGSSELFLRLWGEILIDVSGDEPVDARVLKLTVYPQTMGSWHRLYTSVSTGEVILNELEDFFLAFLDSDSVLKEVKDLYRLSGGKEADATECARNITDFFSIKHKVDQIPAIATFFEVFAFKLARHTNEVLAQLEGFRELDWSTMQFGGISSTVQRVKDMFDIISEAQFELIVGLADARNVVEFLVEYNDDEKFNQFLGYLREITTDEIVLNCSFQLENVRNSLHALLYPLDTLFETETDLLLQLSRVRRPKQLLANLRGVTLRLDYIRGVFAKRTLSPDIKALQELIKIASGRSDFIVEICDENVRVFCKLEKTDEIEDSERKVFTLKQLKEIMLLIYNSKIPEDIRLKFDSIDEWFRAFVEIVDVYQRVIMELSEINQNFSFELMGISSFVITKDSLAEVIPSARNALIGFEQMRKRQFENVGRLRKAHYYLNYFSLREISYMLTEMLNYSQGRGCDKTALMSLFQLIDSGFDDDAFSRLMGIWGVPRLFQLRNLLDRFCKVVDFFQNEAKDAVVRFQFKPIAIIKCQQEEVLNYVLSFFYRFRNIPTHSNVIMCTENTSFEELQLLVFRCENSLLFRKKENIIFAIANVELLSFDTLHSLMTLLKETQLEHFGHLFLISTKSYNIFSSFLFKDDGRQIILSDAVIQRMTAEQCGEDMLVVRSIVAGGGKSRFIEDHAKNCRLERVRICLREKMGPSELIDRLKLSIASTDTSILFHFDVSAHVDSRMNSALFELIHCGTIKDDRCRVFHRRHSDKIAIEIPNTHYLSLPCTNALPTKVIHVDAQTFDPVEEMTAIQLSAKCLMRINNGDFGHFDPFDEPNLPNAVMFDILTHSLNDPNPSYRLISYYSRFLSYHFGKLAMYPVLQLPDHSELRRVLVGLILDSSRDFVSRHLHVTADQKDPFQRFQGMKKWEDSDHPIFIFQLDRSSAYYHPVVGMKILSLDPSKVDVSFPEPIREMLVANGLDLNFNFEQEQRADPQRTELKCFSFLDNFAEMPQTPAAGGSQPSMSIFESPKDDLPPFSVTKDNIVKMLGIVLRIEVGLPVICIGETGTGKTYLVRYICRRLNYRFSKITIHDGISDSEVEEFVEKVVAQSRTRSFRKCVIFFDEINTRVSMKVFEELIFDRRLRGERLPDYIHFVAALNPYRSREFEKIGLEYSQLKMKRDTDLVYSVYPMPDSFVDCLFDFGTLSERDESQYCRSMLVQCGVPIRPAEMGYLIVTITESQRFLRRFLNDLSAASLRDMQRFIAIYKYLKSARRRSALPDETVMIIALAFTYFSRLNRSMRAKYLEMVQGIPPRYLSARTFRRVYFSQAKSFTQKLAIEEKIALNEALTENAFLTFLGLQVNVPVLIIGLPGSSKSLALDLLGKSFKGKGSTTDFCKAFQPTQIFSYQVSPSTTANGIMDIFDVSQKYLESSHQKVILLLEEIGLGLLSPSNPLKVLHEIMAERGALEICAISNYDLDSASMNRFKLILRDQPTARDLVLTAKGIVRSEQLKNLLHGLSRAFVRVYQEQRKQNRRCKDFYGLREFYSLVKHIHDHHQSGIVSKNLLLNCLMRNFGGVEEELHPILRIFEEETAYDLSTPDPECPRPTVIDLIKQNLTDLRSRHLMLITKNNSALNLLFDYKILEMANSIVLFGSDFEHDRTEEQNCLYLEQIKLGMANGRTVILVHCDSIYEAIFDLLNQHYTMMEGKRFAKLALGHSTNSYFVHDDFRMCVIVDEHDAYHRLAAPFLNRLEKFSFYRGQQTRSGNDDLVRVMSDLVAGVREGSFMGTHKRSLDSLTMLSDDPSVLQKKLLRVCTPEGIVELQKKDDSIFREYFHNQSHTSLLAFIAREKQLLAEGGDDTNSSILAVIMTVSPMTVNDRHRTYLAEELGHPVRVFHLHEMKYSKDLSSVVSDFVDLDAQEATLVIYADNTACSLKQIQFTQFQCEQKQKTKTNKRRHILVVVKMSRGRSLSYTFDWDSRWQYSFIDDMNSFESYHFPYVFAEPSLTRLHKLLQSDLVSIIQSVQVTDVTELVLNSMQYLSFGVEVDITSKIADLSLFYRLCKDVIESKIVAVAAIRANKEWFLGVAEGKAFASDSFKHATFQWIFEFYCKVFASIIAYASHNQNLRFLLTERNRQVGSDDDEEEGEFGAGVDLAATEGTTSLLERNLEVIWRRFLDCLSPEVIKENLVALDLGVALEIQQNYVCRFPYSFLLSRFIQCWKNDRDANLEGQLDLYFPFLKDTLDSEAIQSFLLDYLQSCGVFSGEKDIDLNLRFVDLEFARILKENPSATKSLDTVLVCLWNQEARMVLYQPILGCFGRENAMGVMTTDNRTSDEALLTFVISKMDPTRLVTVRRWRGTFKVIEASVAGLLTADGMAGPGADELRASWERILFFDQFVHHMAEVLAVPELVAFYSSSILPLNAAAINAEAFDVFHRSLSEIAPRERCCADCDAQDVPLFHAAHPCSYSDLLCERCLLSSGYIEAKDDGRWYCSACRGHFPSRNATFAVVPGAGGNTAQKQEAFKERCSFVIETFLDQFVLRKTVGGDAGPDEGLLKRIVTSIFRGKYSDEFTLTTHVQAAVLRSLLSFEKSETRATVFRLLEEALTTLCRATLDNQLSGLVCDVLQEKQIPVAENFRVLLFLSRVAAAKEYFRVNLDELVSDPQRHEADFFRHLSLHPQVFIFFLKKVAERHGMSFTRLFLTESAFVHTRFFRGWKSRNEEKVRQFVLELEDCPFQVVFEGFAEAKIALEERGRIQSDNAIVPLLLYECPASESLRRKYARDTVGMALIEKNLPHLPRSKFLRRVVVNCLSIGWTPGTLFHTLLTRAERLVGCYLPTMPTDSKELLVGVLGRGQFYTCKCGAWYFVGECGKTMQLGRCSECNAQIGGQNHEHVRGTTPQGREFQSKKNYLSPVGTNTFQAEREFSPKCFRACRFLINALLYAQALDRPRQVHSLIDNSIRVATGQIVRFFAKHLESDWDILVKLYSLNEEDVAMSMHLILRTVSQNLDAFTRSFGLDQGENRLEFERTFIGIFPKDFFEPADCARHLAEFAAELQQKTRENQERDLLSQEILERLAIPEGNLTRRTQYLPSLFCLRKHSSFQQFLNIATRRQEPLLAQFAELEEQLPVYSRLAGIFRFIELLYGRLSGKISRADAQDLSMKDLISDLSAGERPSWAKVFREFRESFNALWQYVHRFECQELPSNLNISLDTSVAVFLPQENDVSFLLILVRYMVEKYNAFVTVAEQAFGFEPVRTIGFSFYTSAHCVVYDRSRLEDFITAHSTRRRNEVVYDWRAIQHFLFKDLFANKPLIEFSPPAFAFTDIQRTDAKRTILKIIDQFEVPERNVCIARLKQLDDRLVRRLLQFVAVAMNFLSKPFFHLRLDGEKLLHEYITVDLAMRGVSSAVYPVELQPLIRLKHVVAFYDLLQSLRDEDVFVGVAARYKERMEDDSVGEVFAAFLRSQRLEQVKTLVQVLKDYILRFFQAESSGADDRLFDHIEALQYFADEDFEWVESVPDGVKTAFKAKHAVDFYERLFAFAEQQNRM